MLTDVSVEEVEGSFLVSLELQRNRLADGAVSVYAQH